MPARRGMIEAAGVNGFLLSRQIERFIRIDADGYDFVLFSRRPRQKLAHGGGLAVQNQRAQIGARIIDQVDNDWLAGMKKLAQGNRVAALGRERQIQIDLPPEMFFDADSIEHRGTDADWQRSGNAVTVEPGLRPQRQR